MATTTGKLDKLIEEKVNKKIFEFAKSISNQVSDFLKENGEYNGEYLYQARGFELFNQEYRPINFEYQRVSSLQKNLCEGLKLTIKDKMINNETKDLLSKIELL
jgi:hypothetical protein